MESLSLSAAHALYELRLVSPQLRLCHAHRRRQIRVRCCSARPRLPKLLSSNKFDSQVVKKIRLGAPGASPQSPDAQSPPTGRTSPFVLYNIRVSFFSLIDQRLPLFCLIQDASVGGINSTDELSWIVLCNVR